MAQAPEAVPYLEERRAERLAGVVAEKAKVAPAEAEEAAQVAFAGAGTVARVVVAEVACKHHLAQQEAALALVGGREQTVGGRGENAVEHVHHGTREACEPQLAEVVQRGAALVVGAAGEEQVVIVHELTQADAFAEKMAVDVYEQVDAVESVRGYADFAGTFGQGDAAGPLCGCC